MNQHITIATRESALALWQANFVKAELEALHPGLSVELLGMTTRGDQILDSPLAKIGGKGLFVKELETALLDGRADIAVHSMKDVPMSFPEGLTLGVICARENPKDALVSNHYNSINELPEGAIVGTSSLRRSCQLKRQRPDLKIRDLRGNVNTRLAKLDRGDYDAIILATAGLLRLGFQERIAQLIDTQILLPAGGQGAVGIELRENDVETARLLAPLACQTTSLAVLAERAMNQRLNGGCQVPIAAYATVDDQQQITLEGRVGSIDGRQMLEVTDTGSNPEELGYRVAEALIAKGAENILNEVYGES